MRYSSRLYWKKKEFIDVIARVLRITRRVIVVVFLIHYFLMLMKTSFLKVGSALTFAAMLASCTNIQDDGTRTRTEGGLAGALLGAAAGAVIGNQSGRAWEGAAIGAAAGGLAGVAYGNHVANKKANYASKEAWLDACISRAEQVNANAISYNRSLSRRISNLESQLASAKSSGNRSEQRRIKQAVVSLQSETRKELKTVDVEIKEQTSVVSETGSSTLGSRVSSLKSTRSSLNSNEERLADLGNQIDV